MERTERMLMTIDKLKMTTINQLRQIHDLGSYRNAAKVVEKLEPYLNVHRGRYKVFYLNKYGRDLIDSDREVKKTPVMEHTLHSNDAYIYFNMPLDWKAEQVIECEKPQAISGGFVFNFNNKPASIKKKIIADAVFTKQGYIHLVEIDNMQTMKENRKKVDQYIEMWQQIKDHYKLNPILYFFTTTEDRKKKLSAAMGNIRHEVYTFDEIS